MVLFLYDYYNINSFTILHKIVRYTFYKILKKKITLRHFRIISFKIMCDIEAHCSNEEIGRSKADAKVVQKSA